MPSRDLGFSVKYKIPFLDGQRSLFVVNWSKNEMRLYNLASRRYRRHNEEIGEKCVFSPVTAICRRKNLAGIKRNEVVITRRFLFFCLSLRKRGRFFAVYADQIGIIVIDTRHIDQRVAVRTTLCRYV